MSNVKIQGNASGTGSLTIAAPNTNTDITFNLPSTLGNAGASSFATTDASGNLGLGVTPSAWNAVGYKAFEVGALGNAIYSGTNDFLLSANAYYNSGWKYGASGSPATLYNQNNGIHIWKTAPSGTAGNAISFTQAMTLDSSGNLLVGKTATGSTVQGVQLAPAGGVSVFTRNGGAGCIFVGNSSQSVVEFNYNTTTVGSIAVTSSATAYNTSSDYRLKNTIAPMTGALARVAALKPCTYKWNADGSDGEGFIAHELQEVVPDAVTGEKDAVDADGNPVYQGIDTSFLVATLTAAIQEQQALITQLQADVAALKGAA